MPADLFAVAVDWYGPSYSLAQARELGDENAVKECLYLAYERSGKGASYVGISKSILTRLTTSHHALGSWNNDTFELWLGIVKSQSEPGRRPSNSPTMHSAALHFAESLTAYFVGPTLNQRKVQFPPERSGILFNRWFKLEADWPRHRKRPHRNWPDLVECDRDREVGRNIYFGGRIEIVPLS
ncbi:hypothetical protein IVB33_10020 [Bradyrhizobium sp. 24]|uniref:hypothetical protein n=1 Tax=unclassified Bradyrhizobium TaxID=2631580 RepID=UPI001FF9FE4A|nr:MULTISPECIES: hypothetical protein [unclassified Bradyrhizobium]MCK1298064.1 hypothetical protein [Bradyrhizobium sp. 37]MCK1378425.1 hypothetical protein [Bradyrhizobium sp. 24]MCK1772804.1 hypothetical protein [Bradyrhizobium sp. 134]